MTTTVPRDFSREMAKLLKQVLAKGTWSMQTETRLRDAIRMFESVEDPTIFRLRELIKLVLANGTWSAPVEARLRKAAAVLSTAQTQATQ